MASRAPILRHIFPEAVMGMLEKIKRVLRPKPRPAPNGPAKPSV